MTNPITLMLNQTGMCPRRLGRALSVSERVIYEWRSGARALPQHEREALEMILDRDLATKQTTVKDLSLTYVCALWQHQHVTGWPVKS